VATLNFLHKPKFSKSK